MINLPLVSIITACYNDGNYLLDCVNSVNDSLYQNVEHIIIDDGSTDVQTLQILDKLKESDNQKVYHRENRGVCNARNFGVTQSKGKYILFLDGDDKISKKYIPLAVNALEEDERRKVVACNYSFFGRRRKKMMLENFSLERLMGGNIFTVTSMIRKKDFLEIGGFNENMVDGLEDWDFWLSLLENGGEVYYLEGIHFFYRKKKYSQSRNSSISSKTLVKLRKQVYDNHLQLYQNHFFPIIYSFEYLMVVGSLEYRIGTFILKPIRKIFNKIFG